MGEAPGEFKSNLCDLRSCSTKPSASARTGPRRGPETSVGADVVLAGAVAHCVRDDGRPDAVAGESVQVCFLTSWR